MIFTANIRKYLALAFIVFTLFFSVPNPSNFVFNHEQQISEEILSESHLGDSLDYSSFLAPAQFFFGLCAVIFLLLYVLDFSSRYHELKFSSLPRSPPRIN